MASRYTNAVLTVIAISLSVLAIRPLLAARPVLAQPAAHEAEAAGRDPVVKVDIVRIGGWELLSRSALPVEIESGPVPVEISADRTSQSCGCP